MTRTYWDGESEYVECTVVWAGRGSMPHEAADAQFWRMKGNALLDLAPERGAYPSQKEVKKANLVPADMGIVFGRSAPEFTEGRKCSTGCGRKLSAAATRSRNTRCNVCREKKRRARKEERNAA
jgi:hypothetical protein